MTIRKVIPRRESAMLIERSVKRPFLIALVGICILACERSDGANSTPSNLASDSDASSAEFSTIFETVDSIILVESDTVINVTPSIRLDPAGGFLIADQGDARIRKYDESGSLVWQFGRTGEGPGEFSTPMAAVRVSDTQILAIDSHRRAVVWNERTRAVVRTLPYDLVSVDDADPLTFPEVLYSSRVIPGEAEVYQRGLVVFDVETGEVIRRFFQPPIADLDPPLTGATGWIASDVRGDSIAAVFALADSVFLFRTNGTQISQLPISADGFRSIATEDRGDLSISDVMTDHSLASSVYWAGHGDIVVQYQDFENNLPIWHLVGLRLDGTRRWEIRNAPRLHAVDGDLFYFDDPSHLEPNHLLVARRTR